MIRASGSSHADRHWTRHTGELPSLYFPLYFLSDTESMLLVSLRQEYGKLLAAIAAHHVNLSQLLMEYRGNLAQNFIPQQVPEFVIQALELIDVYHNHCHPGIKPACSFQFFGDSQFEETSIKDPCQTIQISQLFHSVHIVGVLNGGRADVGNRFQRLNVIGIERPCLRAVQNQHSQGLPE